ncbi:MAG TPA: alpha/beta hydrolase [Pelomicrobium sp.]|nr:alpha/beta hydrolase [Pelomicrobium sp.]
MLRIKPHVRSAGDGPAVLCIHSSGASSRQWDALAAQLQGSFRVMAADLHGHGGTPAWAGPRTVRIADEAALLGSLVHGAPEGVHLVGHSYGGAVALRLALACPDRVRSVAVYEPTLFRVLFDIGAAHRNALEIARIAVGFRRLARAGELPAAAACFIDYWGGAGAWAALSPRQQAAIAQRMPAVCDHFRALLNDDTRAAGFRRLRCPVLYLTGSASPAPVHAIARRVGSELTGAEFARLPGLGHMAPVTHAAVVNSRIEAFLRANAASERKGTSLPAAAVTQAAA